MHTEFVRTYICTYVHTYVCTDMVMTCIVPFYTRGYWCICDSYEMTDTVCTYIVLIVLRVQGLQSVFDNAVVGRLDGNSQNLFTALNNAYNVSALFSV